MLPEGGLHRSDVHVRAGHHQPLRAVGLPGLGLARPLVSGAQFSSRLFSLENVPDFLLLHSGPKVCESTSSTPAPTPGGAPSPSSGAAFASFTAALLALAAIHAFTAFLY